MNTYTMKSKEIPLDDTWDVIVVGGGPSGCTAAIASAREGAKTLLIEATGALGGMGTSGLVPAWCPFSDKEKIIYGGLAQTIFEKSKKTMVHVKKDETSWVPINAEALKVIYDDFVIGSGAQILFHTTLSAVEADELGNVTTIIVTNKAGLTAYKAKVYVDCTGDADLAAWAGAEFLKGGENEKDLQAASHCFILSNVDDYAYRYGPELHANNLNSPIHNIVDSNEFPLISDKHFCNKQVGPGSVGFNAGHLWNVDNTDPFSVTSAMIAGRKMAAEFLRAIAKYQPKSFGNAYLSSTAPLMGIRETRRIVGDYILVKQDYIDRASFEDEIGRCCYYIDVHRTNAEKIAENDEKSEVEKGAGRYEKGESYGIPYRCLTPKTLKNVLVAGRSISSDRAINGSVRVMPVCLVTGEAAGLSAAIAAKMTTVDVHKVDVAHLRKRLKELGAYLPEKI